MCDDMHLFFPKGRVVAQCTEKPEHELKKCPYDGICGYEELTGDTCDGCSYLFEDTIKKNNHEPPQRGKALKKALEIINGERQDSYGNPEDSFALIGNFWTAYLNAEKKYLEVIITPRMVAEMMTLFKIARMTGQKTTPDNYADAAGYIGIAGDLI
jgi:hypothetical protein